MSTFNGIPVVIHPLVPEYKARMEISPSCPMTDKGREAMNAWLLDFFGKEPCVIFVKGIGMCVHPNTKMRLEQALNDYNLLIYDKEMMA